MGVKSTGPAGRRGLRRDSRLRGKSPGFEFSKALDTARLREPFFRVARNVVSRDGQNAIISQQERESTKICCKFSRVCICRWIARRGWSVRDGIQDGGFLFSFSGSVASEKVSAGCGSEWCKSTPLQQYPPRRKTPLWIISALIDHLPVSARAVIQTTAVVPRQRSRSSGVGFHLARKLSFSRKRYRTVLRLGYRPWALLIGQRV